MCGIAGIIQADPNRFTKEHLKKMTNALAHRGPDGEGAWSDNSGTIHLGHRRLSIIDLSEAGNQPMHYMGRYIIIHNGEIYNYQELKEELQKKGYTFSSQTDTEVIAAAYDCWSSECVTHFDGMFAFTIWDQKNKELFAARDRFGEKPFFYFFDGSSFLFASEMKALWEAGISRTPNRKLLFNFITIGYTDNPNKPEETFFENIFKLPPSCLLKFSAVYFTHTIKQYWQLDPEIQNKKTEPDDAIQQFSSLFKESVKRRLRSDVKIGYSLSGGLDSSSVTAIANKINSNQKPSIAFTAVFPGFEQDESAYARKIAEQFTLEHYTVSPKSDDLLEDWKKLVYHQESPFGSASIYMQYKIYELAKKYSLKVLLEGQGADETLAGYHKYYKWYWQELFRKGKLYRSKELKAAKKIGIREHFDFRNMIASLFPDFATIVLERRYLLHAIRQEDLAKDFIKQYSDEAYYTVPERFTLNHALYFNTRIHGLEELLRFADRNSMANSLEIRLPFLNHELVEFIFSLPSSYKINNGWTKWLLRKTMEQELPADIAWRRDKVGFEPPQKNWMQQANVQAAIREAKQVLVTEKILKPESLMKKITPHPSHDSESYEWRYFSSAFLFK
ncbi:MAG TPA: asparagine synthase (glutamine-hydrolyzing) [Chitinophagaceae bacterium]|nr:asparagine synthase (glutamine-hydrolyzing) [Chitinophagaceae bacterium]